MGINSEWTTASTPDAAPLPQPCRARLLLSQKHRPEQGKWDEVTLACDRRETHNLDYDLHTATVAGVKIQWHTPKRGV